jgi:hypothetical protein
MAYRYNMTVSTLLCALAFRTASAQEQTKIIITPAQQTYRNIVGNEFTMIFTSVAAPEGRTIMIDPDDVMPVVDPRNGKFTATPRFRFLESINSRLPAVPGGPSPAQISQMNESSGSNTVDGKSVSSMFYHLVNDHKVPQQQIWDALKRCIAMREREFLQPSQRR